jgi:hypothetical protein
MPAAARIAFLVTAAVLLLALASMLILALRP